MFSRHHSWYHRPRGQVFASSWSLKLTVSRSFHRRHNHWNIFLILGKMSYSSLKPWDLGDGIRRPAASHAISFFTAPHTYTTAYQIYLLLIILIMLRRSWWPGLTCGLSGLGGAPLLLPVGAKSIWFDLIVSLHYILPDILPCLFLTRLSQHNWYKLGNAELKWNESDVVENKY